MNGIKIYPDFNSVVFSKPDYYTADVVAFNDYYPFGMVMPGRNGGEDFRFGFQGQESDDEVKEQKGTSINYKYRMHDPRVGRFFAVDPLAPKYPHNSPYAFSENRVIDGLELEGKEVSFEKVKSAKSESGKTEITITIDIQVVNASSTSQSSIMNYMGEIKSQVQDSYSYETRRKKVKTVVNITFVKDDSGDGLTLGFVDDVYVGGLKSPKTAGYTDVVHEKGSTQNNLIQIKAKPIVSEGKTIEINYSRTGAHEIGHIFRFKHGGLGNFGRKIGLKKLSQDFFRKIQKNNLMRQSKYTEGTNITKSQVRKAIRRTKRDLKKSEKPT